jgi:hypothetical protein
MTAKAVLIALALLTAAISIAEAAPSKKVAPKTTKTSTTVQAVHTILRKMEKELGPIPAMTCTTLALDPCFGVLVEQDVMEWLKAPDGDGNMVTPFRKALHHGVPPALRLLWEEADSRVVAEMQFRLPFRCQAQAAQRTSDPQQPTADAKQFAFCTAQDALHFILGEPSAYAEGVNATHDLYVQTARAMGY